MGAILKKICLLAKAYVGNVGWDVWLDKVPDSDELVRDPFHGKDTASGLVKWQVIGSIRSHDAAAMIHCVIYNFGVYQLSRSSFDYSSSISQDKSKVLGNVSRPIVPHLTYCYNNPARSISSQRYTYHHSSTSCSYYYSHSYGTTLDYSPDTNHLWKCSLRCLSPRRMAI